MGRLLRMIDPETGQHQVCCGLCHCSRLGQVFVVVVVVDVTVVVFVKSFPPYQLMTVAQMIPLNVSVCRAHKRICCSVAWTPVLVVLALVAALLIRTFTVSER